MTEPSELTPTIITLLAPYNPDNKLLSSETDIPAELNIDSVGVLDFIMEVEDHFDVEIPMNAVANIRTVGELADYVQSRLNKA